MKTNIIDQNKHEDLVKKLDIIREQIEDALLLSINKIKDNPNEEDEILKIWTDYSQDIVDFFNDEIEKINNKKIIKKIIRYAMFRK